MIAERVVERLDVARDQADVLAVEPAVDVDEDRIGGIQKIAAAGEHVGVDRHLDLSARVRERDEREPPAGAGALLAVDGDARDLEDARPVGQGDLRREPGDGHGPRPAERHPVAVERMRREEEAQRRVLLREHVEHCRLGQVRQGRLGDGDVGAEPVEQPDLVALAGLDDGLAVAQCSVDGGELRRPRRAEAVERPGPDEALE